MSRRKLTDRQRDLLEFITQFTRDRGYSPTTTEMAAGLGVSKARARQLALAIEDRGGLVHDAHVQRSWRIVDGRDGRGCRGGGR